MINLRKTVAYNYLTHRNIVSERLKKAFHSFKNTKLCVKKCISLLTTFFTDKTMSFYVLK